MASSPPSSRTRRAHPARFRPSKQGWRRSRLRGRMPAPTTVPGTPRSLSTRLAGCNRAVRPDRHTATVRSRARCQAQARRGSASLAVRRARRAQDQTRTVPQARRARTREDYRRRTVCAQLAMSAVTGKRGRPCGIERACQERVRSVSDRLPVLRCRAVGTAEQPEKEQAQSERQDEQKDEHSGRHRRTTTARQPRPELHSLRWIGHR